jgi:DNA-directed RNA polymerase specialized sigma24 family protein
MLCSLTEIAPSLVLPDPKALQAIALRSAGRVLNNPALAEEASERAMHQLLLSCLAGRPPTSPAAWVTVVARRFATTLSRSPRARMHCLDEQVIVIRPAREDRHRLRGAAEILLRRLCGRLTNRQRDVVAAALTHRTCHGAARACGMSTHDFRRHITAIGRRVRKIVTETPELAALRNGLRSSEQR